MTPGSSALAHARTLLPASFSPPRLTARKSVALAGGLGCAAWSYAGMYPQFDQGNLRLVLALSSLIFGAFVSVKALNASTRYGAFGRAVGSAGALGVASSIVPTLFLGGNPIGMVFGVIFGVPTGLLYGIPLGILAVVAHRGANANSSDGADRVARAAGFWLVPMALIAMAFTAVVDFNRHTYAIPAPPVTLLVALPAMFAWMVALLGAVLVGRALLRMRARRQFLDRVTAGDEPMYRVRDTTGDESPGQRVVEWVPDGAAPTAYRAMAMGIPVAVLDD